MSSKIRGIFNDHKLFPLHIWLELFIIIILILATIVINYKMIVDGINGTGDMRWHLTWMQHFYHQITEGIWYPRWISGTNFGYGSPTFVFYPPLIYYFSSVIRFLGFNMEQTAIILLSLAIFFSGLSFYIYGKNRWNKLSALIGALFYMTTPGIIIYANGGVFLNLFAVAWIPLGAYLTEQAILMPKWRIPLAIFWTTIALTHTPSLLLWSIAFCCYLLFFLSRYSWQSVISTLSAAMIGWGMASIYIVPALLEKSSVTIDYPRLSKGGFQMLDLLELFRSGLSDITNKQLLGILVMFIICLISYRQNPPRIKETWGWFAFIGIVLFFISNLSWPIWSLSLTLQTVETSWRIGGLFYFGEAGLCALAVNGILGCKLPLKLFFSIIIICIILVNFEFGYSLTRKFPTLHNPGRGKVFVKEWLETILYDPYTDQLIDVPEFRPLLDHTSPTTYARERYTDSGMPYFPKDAPSFPVPVLGQARFSVIQGSAEVQLEEWSSYERQFQITAESNARINIRTYNYPAWHLYVNDQEYPIEQAKDGTISFTLTPGIYEVMLRYQWTSAFKAGMVLSLLSIGACIGLGKFQE